MSQEIHFLAGTRQTKRFVRQPAFRHSSETASAHTTTLSSFFRPDAQKISVT